MKEKKIRQGKIVEKLYGEDGIFFNYYLNLTPKGKDIVKDLANEEHSSNYSNLIFKSGDFNVKNF